MITEVELTEAKYQEMMEELFASPGWKEFTKEMQTVKKSAEDAILHGVKSDDYYKLSGQLAVLRFILAYPDILEKMKAQNKEANDAVEALP